MAADDLFEERPKGRPNLDDNHKRILETRVTQYNPELLKLEKVDLLVADECEDSLSDLAEKEITCIAAYRAFNDYIIEIPAMMSFLDNIISLRRSRNAQTAQNLVEILKRRPTYYHSPFDHEIEEKQENKKRWWQFWKKE